MPMPTTRRGRYLFYRKRALRRMAHQRRHRSYPSEFGGHRTTVRREFWLWGKQAPPSSPLRPRHLPAVAPWQVQFWHSPPEYQKPPVVRRSVFDGLGSWFSAHNEVEVLFFQQRRVMSLPRVKLMPLRPYRFTHDQLQLHDYYPWKFYPSGQRSYAGTLDYP